MTALRLQQWCLRIRLALARFKWGNIVALIFCGAGIAGWVWGVPQLHNRVLEQQTTLTRTELALRTTDGPAPAVPRSLAENRLAAFYDALGEKKHTEQQLKTLFALAAKNGLTLQQAEYKAAFDKNGRFHTYQISLPVKGSYGAIRAFCEQVLLAIPFASLDEIGFKRDAVGTQTLEAKLRFTLYLSDAEPAREIAFAAKEDKR